MGRQQQHHVEQDQDDQRENHPHESHSPSESKSSRRHRKKKSKSKSHYLSEEGPIDDQCESQNGGQPDDQLNRFDPDYDQRGDEKGMYGGGGDGGGQEEDENNDEIERRGS